MNRHRISVFGLGYVGSVTAACLADRGNQVIGVDPQAPKVDAINGGHAPILEEGLGDLVARNVTAGRLRATCDAEEAVRRSDLTIICIGTPSRANGDLDLGGVLHACGEIGSALRRRSDGHIIVVRSTVLPGTIRERVAPALEAASGKRRREGFLLAHNPEFLREGTAIRDFHNPPKTVIGADDPRAAAALRALCAEIDGPVLVTTVEAAEMVKYADNAWHALKIAFSNEIGNVCKAAGIDSYEVMRIFCHDTKLNISAAYLRPGFAFGGSCLPKDLRALTYLGRRLDLDLPVLGSVMPSNRIQVEHALHRIVAMGRRRVSVLGFSFKPGTDDLRESPLVELVERLLGKGFDIRLYDRNVNLARLIGANREFVFRAIPHIASLMVNDVEKALEHAELVVVGYDEPEFRSIAHRIRRDQFVLDMARISEPDALEERYDGINW
jgi:GDP-mannose 6-dehydrogenase